jgi:hypothetical protein
MRPRNNTKRKAELAIVDGPRGPVLLNGAHNVRTLSARFMADMQTHWEKNGMQALDIVLAKSPERYVSMLVDDAD